MGYIPEGAKWYIAEIVEEITVEDDPRNLVHVNFNLIRADSPDEAYRKAIKLGQSGETEYENPNCKHVQIRFKGLRQLDVIYDELEDGAELLFERKVAVSSTELQAWIKERDELEAFRPWRPPNFEEAPDYAAKEILDEVETRFGKKRFEGMKSDGSDNR